MKKHHLVLITAVCFGLSLFLLSSVSQAKPGAYVQGGLLGAFETGLSSDVFFQNSGDDGVEAGPGFQVGLGYNGDLLGVRGSFYYAHMEERVPVYYAPVACPFGGGFGCVYGLRPGPGSDVHMYGVTIDGTFYPVQLFAPNTVVDPYLVLGIGASFLDIESTYDSRVGMGSNIGLGVDFHITEAFSLALEGALRPIWFFEESCGSGYHDCNNDGDLRVDAAYPVMVSGMASYHF